MVKVLLNLLQVRKIETQKAKTTLTIKQICHKKETNDFSWLCKLTHVNPFVNQKKKQINKCLNLIKAGGTR